MNTSQKNKKLVMFDFDGVLVNTLEFCYRLHKDANKGLTWEKFSSFSNGNFHEGMGKAINEDGHIRPKDFDEKYEQNLLTLTIHDILHEAILSMADSYRLAVVSSITSGYIQEFLIQENSLECFSEILGSDMNKSKVYKIKSLIDKYSYTKDEAVYITDTLGDI